MHESQLYMCLLCSHTRNRRPIALPRHGHSIVVAVVRRFLQEGTAMTSDVQGADKPKRCSATSDRHPIKRQTRTIVVKLVTLGNYLAASHNEGDLFLPRPPLRLAADSMQQKHTGTHSEPTIYGCGQGLEQRRTSSFAWRGW